MAKAEMGICLRSCVECRVQNVGAALVDMLSWNPNRVNFMLAYDRERDVLIVDETMLMNAISMVNPAQRPRKLELGNVEMRRKEIKSRENNA